MSADILFFVSSPRGPWCFFSLANPFFPYVTNPFSLYISRNVFFFASRASNAFLRLPTPSCRGLHTACPRRELHLGNLKENFYWHFYWILTKGGTIISRGWEKREEERFAGERSFSSPAGSRRAPATTPSLPAARRRKKPVSGRNNETPLRVIGCQKRASLASYRHGVGKREYL